METLLLKEVTKSAGFGGKPGSESRDRLETERKDDRRAHRPKPPQQRGNYAKNIGSLRQRTLGREPTAIEKS